MLVGLELAALIAIILIAACARTIWASSLFDALKARKRCLRVQFFGKQPSN
jgi:hypothetical protein